jgi:ankyrin repeat protein
MNRVREELIKREIRERKLQTLFEYIISGENDKVAHILRENPQLLFAKDNQGNSTLQFAVIQGNVGMVADILRQKPKLMFDKNNSGHSPFQYALWYQDYHIVKMMAQCARNASMGSEDFKKVMEQQREEFASDESKDLPTFRK